MPITMYGAGLTQTVPGPTQALPGNAILMEGGTDAILMEGGGAILMEGGDIYAEDNVPEWLRVPSKIWRAFLPLLFLVISAAAFGQGSTIGNLSPATTPLGGDEKLPIVQPGTCTGSNTCNKRTTVADIWAGTSIPDTTHALPYTIATADLNGLITLTGAGNLTFAAGVITTGKFVCYTNANPIAGGNNATIVGTINGLPNTTVYPGGGGCVVGRSGGTYDWSPGVPGGDVGLLSILQQWTKPQQSSKQTPAISGSSFTMDFGAAQHFTINLVHASCPCTIANPTNLPVAGKVQEGMIEVIQSGTGSDLASWGTVFQYVGGTSIITLSTTAGTTDYFPYHISDGVHVVLGGIVKGPAH